MRFFPTASAREAETMSPAALREAFLVSGLFVPGELSLALTELDRLLIGTAVPQANELALPALHDLGTEHFCERRELGIFNLGAPGMITVDSEAYQLQRLDCLYVGKGHRNISFSDCGDGTPRFFFASCPAHARFPTRKLMLDEVAGEQIGETSRSSSRRLRKFIHPGAVCSSQLVMGFTEIDQGSAWNTMPPHTHSRRSEIYLYFDLAGEVVAHFMGPPATTRHLFVREGEAVLSPPWSIHMGAGAGAYRFIWVMAGENQDFADVDPVALSELY